MRPDARGLEAKRGFRGEGRRFALVVSRFNSSITEALRDGALSCLRAHGTREEDVHTYRVPGAWELPQVAKKIVELDRYDAVIPLGCVIRGETSHFDFVAGQAAGGLGAVARQASIPVVFGVLTTDTLEQAEARARGDRSNKGWEAALAALELVALFDELCGGVR